MSTGPRVPQARDPHDARDQRDRNRPSGRWAWIREGALAATRGLCLCGLALGGACLLLFLIGMAPFAAVLYGLHQTLGRRGLVITTAIGLPLIVVALAVIHKGALSIAVLVILAALAVSPLAVSSLLTVRALAMLTRRLSGLWCGVAIAVPYRRSPEAGLTGYSSRLRWMLGDPAGRRDLQWLAVNACAGWALAAAPAGLIIIGLFRAFHDTVLRTVASPVPDIVPGDPFMLFLIGLGLMALGLWASPRLLRGYGLMARAFLAPGGEAELRMRVHQLAETRSDVIDAGAAEMRRIERDLHDGAQARLVAMGMTLDAADQLLDDNPSAARALLAEARESSARALAELRDLVRGIHPPVLADRGLAEAVRALALETPVRVQYASELSGRPPAPVESAAYFAVSELLANVVKHAHARRAWVDLRHDAAVGGTLRITVSDDGVGGADPGRGSGLAGIERRLAAFDGVVAVSSPPGGPTVVNMEIPCALSSPKTSSC